MLESTSIASNSSEMTKCLSQLENPWCGQFGAPQVFDVIYLTIVTVIGTFGNLMVIFSIILEKRVHKHGNLFVINLAVADLIVTGLFVPSAIANVIETGNPLPIPVCRVLGYIVTTTCICSMYTLTFISLNRYWAIARHETLYKAFAKTRVKMMIFFTWVWSSLLTSPTFLGWSELIYDAKLMACSWDDTSSMTYNILLMVFAIFIPISVTTFCYFQLFMNVRRRTRSINTLCGTPPVYRPTRPREKRQKFIHSREIDLLRTLATSVIFFVLCWAPYGFCVLIDPKNVDPLAKKIFGRLGISNSAVNFVIYGAMNETYRKGYMNLISCILHCKKYPSKSRMLETNALQRV